jgi:hypothetical protein
MDAVRARLAANWDEDDAAIFDANSEGTTPSDGAPFIVIQFPVSETSRWPVDRRYYREEGGIRIVIHTVRGSGDQQALEWADTISDIFRDQTFSGVRCQVPSTPLVDDDADRGLYFATSVVVPYWYTFTD